VGALGATDVTQPLSVPTTPVIPGGTVPGWAYWKVGLPPVVMLPVTLTSSGAGTIVTPPSA
jgi:hypothetical protein